MALNPLRSLPLNVRDAVKAVADGDVAEEQRLAEGYKRAAQGARVYGLDNLALASLHSNVLQARRAKRNYREQQRIAQRILGLSVESLAFGNLPDQVREEHSRFCELMYLGLQSRFLNAHPGETPEDFLDRPRKRTVNLTKLAVKVKSTLYLEPPRREVGEDTPDAIKERLEAVWSDLFDLSLLEVDRMTRLCGTVAVRPLYDKRAGGKIRLSWLLSHQLRVIPDEDEPWRPAVVIERPNPWDRSAPVLLWTEKSLVKVKGREVSHEAHGLGGLPHVFFRDRLSCQALLVEGEGRDLCEANAVINDKLTDLNEIIQLQGFSIMEVVNPDEDAPDVGPRSALVFRPQDNTVPYGVNFKTPNAQIQELRAEVADDVRDLFRAHRIPEVAVSVALGSRAISGEALKVAFEPVLSENRERARLFRPAESELADACLRVIAANEPGFAYDPEQPVEVNVTYREGSVPMRLADELKQHEFDLSHGLTTPAEILHRRDPSRFGSLDKAREQVAANLEENGSAAPAEEEDRDPVSAILGEAMSGGLGGYG